MMQSATEYLWFTTKKRRDLVRITGQVEEVVARSGVREGFCLVSAMHITASVWVNDDEPGLREDSGRCSSGSRRKDRTTSTTAPARTTATRT